MSFKIIIPAREGSKGLPGKNIKILYDKPLIDYSIETALSITEADSVIITSDSIDILERGEKFGVKTLLRPKQLALDDSPILETIFHAVNYYKENLKEEIDQILLLQPTFPFRDVSEIKKAINLFKIKNLRSLVSVNQMKEHPCDCISISKEDKQKWNFLVNPYKKTNRQSYQGMHFFINGNFYMAKIKSLRIFNSFFFKETYFFESNNKLAIDIDNIEDFKYAEYCIFREKNINK